MGDSPEELVPWHSDFFRRPATISGGGFDGDCVQVRSSHFDWADVFLLAEAFSVSKVSGLKDSCVHREPLGAAAGSLLLVAGPKERPAVPGLGLLDPLSAVILVVALDSWDLLWAAASGEV